MQNRWLGIAAMVFAVGCGGGGGSSSNNNNTGGAALHCSYAAGYCVTIRAPTISSTQSTALQTECTTDFGGGAGTFGTGACPTANAVAGSCALPASIVQSQNPPAGMVVSGTFYTPNFDATSASAACGTNLGGTWSGGGGGGGGGGAAVMSCSMTSQGWCEQYNAATAIPAGVKTALQQYCTAASGTYSDGSGCPSAGRIAGSCTYDMSGDLGAGGIERDYFYPPFNTTAAQQMCSSSGGTWVP